MFTEDDCNITAAWQINSQEKFLTQMDKKSNRVLMIILDMHNIYQILELGQSR